jgi:EAL and modified HD-GYP domain-containing signal transduction protein
VNSAAFAQTQEIRSIRQAIVLLGLQRIRQWASVWSMAGLNSGGTAETATVAILRARCCELLADSLSGANGSEFFMLGLCSLLDAMLGRRMATLLGDLPLSAPIRAALLGESNVERSVLDAAIAYEQGDWSGAMVAAQTAGVSPQRLPDAYAESLQWARELSRTSAPAESVA